jgi:hypothetical protein
MQKKFPKKVLYPVDIKSVLEISIQQTDNLRVLNEEKKKIFKKKTIKII